MGAEARAAMDLPVDADGACMCCGEVPPEAEAVVCGSCGSPWHLRCLRVPKEEGAGGEEGQWACPDCSESAGGQAAAAGDDGKLVSELRAIQADAALTDAEKARRSQALFGGATSGAASIAGTVTKEVQAEQSREAAQRPPGLLDEKMNCIFCLQLVDRPVTTPCGHNFCLKCFEKWIGQGKKTCAKCRTPIPAKMASQPRINSALVSALRFARLAASGSRKDVKVVKVMSNESRPEKAFTSERAVKTGKANACSGRIFVTISPDYFGPIGPEHDPVRGTGVLVGETWEDRMECRQWGAHLPHVAGIAGQSEHGAQSVALSGGYEDDMDMGEYFLYTGSGGRDLSGNKRTNKEHSFDQVFESGNEALRRSCLEGYPVRVVRSHKEKRSSYAPETGVRYDGIYRIEKCWRKKGAGGHLVCRYLFVRCDNEPAPWTSLEHGDRPRPVPTTPEMKHATDVTARQGQPAWAWKEDESGWGWSRDPPQSKKSFGGGPSDGVLKRKQLTTQQRLLREFACKICNFVLEAPVSTPCGHNFCKACLTAKFSQGPQMRERASGVRSLRVQRVVKACPASRCGADLAEFLLNPQVNLEMVDIIEALKGQSEQDGDTTPPKDQDSPALAVNGAATGSPQTKKPRKDEAGA